MLGNMLSGLVDTEKLTRDTIQNALEEIAEELQCSHKEFFVMIKPSDEKFNMKFYIYRIYEDKAPAPVREISLKEILGG